MGLVLPLSAVSWDVAVLDTVIPCFAVSGDLDAIGGQPSLR